MYRTHLFVGICVIEWLRGPIYWAILLNKSIFLLYNWLTPNLRCLSKHLPFVGLFYFILFFSITRNSSGCKQPWNFGISGLNPFTHQSACVCAWYWRLYVRRSAKGFLDPISLWSPMLDNWVMRASIWSLIASKWSSMCRQHSTINFPSAFAYRDLGWRWQLFSPPPRCYKRIAGCCLRDFFLRTCTSFMSTKRLPLPIHGKYHELWYQLLQCDLVGYNE